MNYNLSAGWYLTSVPILTANWKADKAGDVWTVPLGGGVGRLFKIGNRPIDMQLQVFDNVARPQFGADWQLRFQVKLPFAGVGFMRPNIRYPEKPSLDQFGSDESEESCLDLKKTNASHSRSRVAWLFRLGCETRASLSSGQPHVTFIPGLC